MIDYEKIAKDQRLASWRILSRLAPLGAAGVIAAWHMTGMVMLGYNQSHTCTMPRKQEIIRKCNITWTEQQSSLYIPWNSETKSLDSCTRYVYNSINCTFWRSNNTQISANDDSAIPIEKCDSWTYDTSVFTTTVLGEFDLVCDNKQKGRLSQAIFMLGVMIGVSAWGQISDRFGRKISAILPLVIGIGVGIATAFSNSFALFVALRFFVGLTYMPSNVCSYVLGTEILKGGRVVLVSQIDEVIYAMGTAILSGIGYLVRDWRRLQLWISAPGAILVIWMCFTLESPRWLIAKKRYAKADRIIRKLLTQEKYQRNVEARKLRSLCQIQGEGADCGDRMKAARLKDDELLDGPDYQNKADNNTVLDILKLPNLRKRSLIMYYMWMVISALYYGLTLNSADLGGDVFVNLCISALVEFPAAFLAIPMMDKWGRRPTTTSMLCLSGTVCICMMFVSKEMVWLNVLLSTIGKFSVSIAFGTAYVYAIEIYPTPVRNVGLGVCNSWARIGGMLAPFIAMLDVIGFAVPYVAFGLMAVLAGLLGFLLPETLRKKTPETLEEAEQFGKHDEGIMAFCCRKNNSPVTDRSTDGEWKDSPLE